MAKFATFDLDNKIIQITKSPILENGQWVVDIDVKIDLYSAGKEDWVTGHPFMAFVFPLTSVGGDPLPGSKALGSTFFLASDWKIRPYEGDHVFRVNGNLYSTDGTSPFTSTIGSYNVLLQQSVSSLVDSTVQQLKELQYSSFQNAVWIDPLSSQTGTDYPSGNRQNPVNNLVDALAIAANWGFKVLEIVNDISIGSGLNIDDFYLHGFSHVETNLVMEDMASCANVTIDNFSISGVLDGGTHIRNCVVGDITYVNGHIHDSGIRGTITLGGNEKAAIINCYTVDPDYMPTIDMGGSGQDVVLTNFTGDVQFRNSDSANNNIFIGLSAGSVTIDNTVTAGSIVINGIGALFDYSSNTTINKDGLLSRELLTEASWDTVYIDADNGIDDTTFPSGMANLPLRTLSVAKQVADLHGIKTFHITGHIVLTEDMSGYHFRADSVGSGTVDLNGQNVEACQFTSINLTGTPNGHFYADDCTILSGMSNINASMTDIHMAGAFVLADGGSLQMDKCIFPSGASFDLNGNGHFMSGNMSGILTLLNATDPSCTIALTGYYMATLDSSITEGAVLAAGIGILIKQNGPNVQITERTLPSATFEEMGLDHLTPGTIGAHINNTLGLSKSNYRILNPVYDANGRLTSAIFRIYSNAADCDADTNHINQYNVVSTYNNNGDLTSYKVTESA